MLSPGIRFMIYSIFLISIMHTCVKVLEDIPVSEIILFRSVISLILCFAMIKAKKINLPGEHLPLLLLRGLLGSASIFTFFYSLQHVPLASAVTISYLSPFFIALAGLLYLKEKIDGWQWIFFFISFLGVYLIKGYDNRISSLELFVCVLSALFSALAHFSIRLIKKGNDPWLIIFYFSLITIPLSLPFAIANWVNPALSEVIILGLIGLLSHFGQYFLTRAYQMEEVSKISHVYFLGIAISICLGYVFFKELFNFQSLTGISLIVSSILVNLLVQKKTSCLE
jgi:drug/metabolite transporter (DMT)-like permease